MLLFGSEEKSPGSRLSEAAGTQALPSNGLLQGTRAGLTGTAAMSTDWSQVDRDICRTER